MTPAISIIVPIYQSEHTIRKCLDSILSQSFRNIEVLLVDDGSTDKSAEICDEYTRYDSRFRLLRKIHSGVSNTRQMGLENALGEYVIHCDSDDWMEPQMLETLFIKAKDTGADMVVCDFVRDKKNKSECHIQFPNGYYESLALKKQINHLSFAVWNKLVKRDIFIQHKIQFPNDLTMAEDIYVTMRILNLNIKIAYVPIVLYHYQEIKLPCYKREDIYSNITVVNCLMECLDDNLLKKLNSNKRSVIITAFQYKLMSRQEILCIFPEVHFQVFVLSLLRCSLHPLAWQILYKWVKSFI